MPFVKVAVLTGGGDCPGLNAVIRAVVRRGEQHKLEVMGVRDGWVGLMEERHMRLTRTSVAGTLHLGGTILGTSRVNPFKEPDGPARILRTVERLSIGAVVAIGGEGSLSIAREMHGLGLNVIGVPKTIDNDLNGTDFTFGFDTAVSIATEAIDRLHSTAEAHQRVMVVEVMGRHVGWIAAFSGIAGGADAILVPERPIRIEEVVEHVERRRKAGRKFSIVVCAEGAEVDFGEGAHVHASGYDAFGHLKLGGIGQLVAAEIERRTGSETRVTVLGHTQRGGSPTAYDRVLATRFGVQAADMVARKEWGRMAAMRGNQMTSVPLEEATRSLKTLDPSLYEIASVFFG